MRSCVSRAMRRRVGLRLRCAPACQLGILAGRVRILLFLRLRGCPFLGLVPAVQEEPEAEQGDHTERDADTDTRLRPCGQLTAAAA